LNIISVASYNFALFILYLLLVCFIVLQLGRIIYYRHKIRSFQAGFLIQCFFWALLRAIFFLLSDFLSSTNWLLLFIFWIPINIQFSTFSLLVVYYAYLNPLHEVKAEMRKFKRFYFTVWFVTNIVFFIGTLVGIILGVKYDDPYENEPDWLTAAHGYFTGSVFLVLVIVMAYHAFKVFHLIRQGPRSKLLAKISLNKIAFVTLALFLLFMSRSSYDFIVAAGISASYNLSPSMNKPLFSFVIFVAWEIIPTILVLVLFGTVNSTTLGAFGNLCPCFKRHNDLTPYASVKYQSLNQDPGENMQSSLHKAQLVNDPKHYDSDNDSFSQGTSPLSGVSPSSFSTPPVVDLIQ